MNVYIVKRDTYDFDSMVIVAANNVAEAVDVLRNDKHAFLYFHCYDEKLNVIEDRMKWRFDSEEWDMYECPALTANVDEPQIIDGV